MRSIRIFAFLVLSCVGVVSAGLPGNLDLAKLRGIPVLEGGRVKPLAVAATEAIQEIHGRAVLAKRHASLEAWFMLMLQGKELEDSAWISLSYRPLRKKIGLPEVGNHASYRELSHNIRLESIVAAAHARQQGKLPLSSLDRKAIELERRLVRWDMVSTGREFALLPGPSGSEGNWRSLIELGQGDLDHPSALLSERTAACLGLLQALQRGDQGALDMHAATLSREEMFLPQNLRTARGQVSASAQRVRAELWLFQVHPFRWSWLLLLGSALAIVAGQILSSRERWTGPLGRMAWELALASLATSAVGFALRIFVSGRAPVTNMYETTLWVAFGATLFGMGFAALWRSRIVLGATAVAGSLVFLLADAVPSVLDPRLQPLVPVLRSNFWLTLHVLTVTISYAAFLLAMAIGNLGLWQAFRPGSEAFLKEISQWCHRVLLLGVLLLTAGILLGGVWADYAWGRFWGWDPKETWSLIANLGYLVILHGRFVGWIRAWGTVVGAVVGFYGVVMAWYGVNFILATGLHSYGFSQGGALAMAVYAVVQGIYLVVCQMRHRRVARN
ncbi:MAG: hypothetical protein RL318_860 [Fibrobacterota bacterium]